MAKSFFGGFGTLEVIFEFYMVSWRPGRYLETFLEPVASLWLSMGPWRAVATPFASKMTDILCSWQAKHVLCCPWETRMCSSERAHMPSFEKPAKWGPNKWGPNQWGPNRSSLSHKHLDPMYLDPITSHLTISSRTNCPKSCRAKCPRSCSYGCFLSKDND